MPHQATVLKVFVASPEDVSEERDCLEEVIRELNMIWAQQLSIRLELIRWETHTYPGFGEDPQAVINEQISQDFDIFIGLMWYRFGTPTGRAGSGTVEEFSRAKKRYDQNPDSLQLMIYFKDAPAPIPPSELDLEQVARVSEFRSSLGEQGGLYKTFQTVSEFKNLVRMHLSLFVQKAIPQASALSPSTSNGKETLAPDYTGQIEHEDDEIGLLDLLEQVEDEFVMVVEVIERITDATGEIGEKMHARTAQIAVFTAGKDATDRKAGKRLLEQVAGDMDHYVVRMESELPLFSQYLDSTMNALVQAATLLFEFKDNDDTRDQAKEMMQNMRGFRTVLEVAEDAITTFLQEVTALPPITTVLNRSKRAMARVLRRMINDLHGAQVMAREVEMSFAALVEDE